MNNEKVIEGNKLIAEFMGYNKEETICLLCSCVYQEGGCSYSGCGSMGTEQRVLIPEYHSSRDWLHTAIDKIKNIDPSEFNYDAEAMANFRYQKQSVTDMRICVDIDHAFAYVVEFITWYNQNKPK